MAKILFVPTTSREIAQFSLVKPELEALRHEVMAIALDKGKAMDKSQEVLEAPLQEKKFRCKAITDYKTRNVLNIINKEKPDILIVDFGGFTPNAFIYTATHLGIPCLQIDDGIVSEYSRLINIPLKQSLLKLVRRAFRLLLLRANPRPLAYLWLTLGSIYPPRQFLRKMALEMVKSTYTISSYTEGLNIATMSPFARNAYLSMGVPADKVFVTGQPRFDLIGQKKYDRKRFMAELGVPEDKGIVVLATQPLGSFWTEGDREEFINTVISALSEFPEKQLVIKLHPGEKMAEYQQMLAKMEEDRAIICQKIDLYELLHACDLLMTVHSTVALEAMLLNKPVITINLTGKPDLMPYAESGAALGVYQRRALAPAINKALYDPEVRKNLAQSREKFISKYAYRPDGQAAKRVTELITRLIEESKSNIKGGTPV